MRVQLRLAQTMPGQKALTLARVYYGLAGLLAAWVGLGAILGAIGAAGSGCQLVFSQADFVEPPTTGPIPDDLPPCQAYVDVGGIVLPLLLGGVLLYAGWFLLRERASRVILGAAALAGILVGAVPAYLVWWVIGYYRVSPGPLEVLVAVVPLLAALGTGWVTLRALVGRVSRPAGPDSQGSRTEPP